MSSTEHGEIRFYSAEDDRMQFKKVHPDAQIPTRAHPSDAGLDLYCTHDIVMGSEERAVANAGVAVKFTPGTFGMVTPRSGLAAKKGITILNSPGIIDPGYRGELKVVLFNTSKETVTLEAGSRVAQLVIAPLFVGTPLVVEEFKGLPTKRGDNGFGSTGA